MPSFHDCANPPEYKGLGGLSNSGREVVGIDFIPTRAHCRGMHGEIPTGALAYFNDLPLTYGHTSIGSLANKGDRLILDMEGLYQSMCALQEIGMMRMQPKFEFSESHRQLIPDQSPCVISTMKVGAAAVYQGGAPARQEHEASRINARPEIIAYQLQKSSGMISRLNGRSYAKLVLWEDSPLWVIRRQKQ